MLTTILQESLIQLNIAAADREDAIRKAAQPLLDQMMITEDYIEDILLGIQEYGPYIAIAKGVVLSHARPEKGALKTAIGITTLAEPVEFGSRNDPIQFIFTLSALDSETHIEALSILAEFLHGNDFYEVLKQAQDVHSLFTTIQAMEQLASAD